jgi:hypothetical protein
MAVCRTEALQTAQQRGCGCRCGYSSSDELCDAAGGSTISQQMAARSCVTLQWCGGVSAVVLQGRYR